MNLLDNQSLVNAYKHAVELRLDQDFIQLLLQEIKHRNLHI